MKNKIKKILFVTARLPYPATSGRKNVMFNYCKILHEVYGFDIYIASFLEEGDKIEVKPDFIKEVIVLDKITAKKKLANLIFKTFLLKKYPMQVSLFYDDKTQSRINEYIETLNPDMVIADMVRTTEYLRSFDGFKVADLDDLLSIRYERQLKVNIKEINPYGAYLFSLPKFIQNILLISFIKKYILKNEIKLLKKYEKEISKYFNKVVFVAEKEASILNDEMNFDKAISVPLGVDVDYYGEFYNKLDIKADTIGFLGAMSVAHNESGILHFINDIFPNILKIKPKVKLIIVGGGVTQKVKNIVKDNKNIIITGRVDDVRQHIGSCSVFICPLTFGSGIKTKNLEAMAMGVPVVTTSFGAENINAEDRKDWIIANTVEEFANAVIDVLCDNDLHNELAKNGNMFVKNNFTWKVAEKKIKNILPKEN